jgi:hypothetical protein
MACLHFKFIPFYNTLFLIFFEMITLINNKYNNTETSTSAFVIYSLSRNDRTKLKEKKRHKELHKLQYQ